MAYITHVAAQRNATAHVLPDTELYSAARAGVEHLSESIVSPGVDPLLHDIRYKLRAAAYTSDGVDVAAWACPRHAILSGKPENTKTRK